MANQRRVGRPENPNEQGIIVDAGEGAIDLVSPVAVRINGVPIIGVAELNQYVAKTEKGAANGVLPLDASARPTFTAFAASATAGANGDLPAQIQGYLSINIGGGHYKVPYYNA